MAATRELSIGDAVDAAPVGARGGVTDILDECHVIVEVMTLPLEPILDRIVVVSPEALRLVNEGQAGA